MASSTNVGWPALVVKTIMQNASPWSSCTSVCWEHVSAATEIARVATILTIVQIETVIPIISTQAPTLLITIPNGSSRDTIKRVTRQISSLMMDDSKWESFVRGEHWLCRLTLKSKVRIDITTSILASEPTKFEV